MVDTEKLAINGTDLTFIIHFQNLSCSRRDWAPCTQLPPVITAKMGIFMCDKWADYKPHLTG